MQLALAVVRCYVPSNKQVSFDDDSDRHVDDIIFTGHLGTRPVTHNGVSMTATIRESGLSFLGGHPV